MAIPGSIVASGKLVTPGGQVGPSGATGTAGAPGAAGSPGTPAWTLTTAGFTVPAVGLTAIVNVADTSWAVVGEYVWVATAGGSANAPMALQIQGKTGTTLTLLNPPTAGTQPSSDAQNLLTVGSDSLLYLPPSAIQPVIWSVRNRTFNSINNPCMSVDQWNCGNLLPMATNSGMVLDRWWPALFGSTMACTTQQTAGNIAIPGTNFFITSTFLRLTLTAQQASLGSGDYLGIGQNIEGPNLRALFGDVHSLQILCRSSVANHKFTMLVGDAGYPATKALGKLCTIPSANTWTLISFPALPIWPGSASLWPLTPGTKGYFIALGLAAGSTQALPANDTWQDVSGTPAWLGAGGDNWCAKPVGSTFDIAYIGHEPGPVCSAPQDCPFTKAYDDCLRYTQKSYPYDTPIGTTGGSGFFSGIICGATQWAVGNLEFSKPLCKMPSLTWYDVNDGSTGNAFNATTAAHVPIGGTNATEKGIQSLFFNTAQLLGHWMQVQYVADVNF